MRPIAKQPWRAVAQPSAVKRKREVSYFATGWDSDKGKYVERRCDNVLFERHDGTRQFLNTSPSVSYYDKLMRWAYA